ncbi:lipase chaperone [Pseudomonas cavernae]|uniref:Lipase chaperone n=1 Tax=Pseudomonas cavernae TaxID=2320867 RepID=A0A385Z0Z5_9PSED|nr:lipase secretion chaperone [Pseudomonas cavernae]AYC32879.1 lipase chaperone [Pseudomonas cavernae]
MPDQLLLRALAIAGLGGLSIWATLALYPDTPARPSATPAARTTPTPDPRTRHAIVLNSRLRQTPVAELPDSGPLPASLRGARHDVHLQVDERGNLLVEEAILHLFDFYLSGLEEEGIDKVLVRLHRDLAAQLHGVALTQARDLLRRYVDYRIALQDLPKSAGTLAAGALRQRLDALNALRDQYFVPAEYEALFARENVEDDYMLQRLAIAQQPELSLDQQRQAQAELEAQLPVELRETRARVTRQAELYSSARALQESGASAEAIHQLREQALGSAAADRLAELDQQHAAWKQRLSDYAVERNRLHTSGLAPSDLQRAIGELQASRFDELERKRVRALDAEL